MGSINIFIEEMLHRELKSVSALDSKKTLKEFIPEVLKLGLEIKKKKLGFGASILR